MIQPNRVDRADCRLGVGISGEQHFAGIRVKFHRFGQKFGSIHTRHTLVCQEKGNLVVTLFKLLNSFQRFGSGCGFYNAVLFAIMLP